MECDFKENSGADCRCKYQTGNVVSVLDDTFQNVKTRRVGGD